MYGLSREWLVRDGVVVPRTIVLSHDEQYARMAEAVPEALDSAFIAGDPCLDRMFVSESSRRRYRASLGVDDDATVVLVTSTWGPDSLMGRRRDLIAQLLAELPADDYVVTAVLHPNTWFAHGPAQIRLWLADALRAGLRLVPPAEGWQPAVIAADVVIGDHGAVTAYAAALGKPTLLASFPEHQVAKGSAVAALGRAAQRLDPVSPFTTQLETATAGPHQFPEVRELASSMPGKAAGMLRKHFYELMDLAEPDRTSPVAPYDPAGLVPERADVAAWWVAAEWHGPCEVTVTRWPADVDSRSAQPPEHYDRHLVVASRHPRRDLSSNAAIVVTDDPDEIETVFANRPVCSLIVAGTKIIHRDGGTASITLSEPDQSGIIACASAIHAWLSLGRDWASLPGSITTHLGGGLVSAAIDRRSVP